MLLSYICPFRLHHIKHSIVSSTDHGRGLATIVIVEGKEGQTVPKTKKESRIKIRPTSRPYMNRFGCWVKYYK